MSTTSINLLSGGLLQGTIEVDGGFLPNSTRVIMADRIALPDFVGRSYVISATTSTGKTINTSFVGYADSTTQMFIYDSDWQSNPKTYDLSSQNRITHFRILLKYSDNSTILPEEITALTLSDTAIFHAAEGEYPINDLTPPLLQTDFRRPFPASRWRIDESNGGYPYTDYHLGVIYAMPTTGSFENAASLSRVHIHDTVKAFGESAFAGTKLRHVRIAADCTYSEQSFPEGCVVTRYPDDRYEQLYDCDGKAVLDYDGARVYVLKEDNNNG